MFILAQLASPLKPQGLIISFLPIHSLSCVILYHPGQRFDAQPPVKVLQELQMS
jgi:hypothetical protein